MPSVGFCRTARYEREPLSIGRPDRTVISSTAKVWNLPWCFTGGRSLGIQCHRVEIRGQRALTKEDPTFEPVDRLRRLHTVHQLHGLPGWLPFFHLDDPQGDRTIQVADEGEMPAVG